MSKRYCLSRIAKLAPNEIFWLAFSFRDRWSSRARVDDDGDDDRGGSTEKARAVASREHRFVSRHITENGKNRVPIPFSVVLAAVKYACSQHIGRRRFLDKLVFAWVCASSTK